MITSMPDVATWELGDIDLDGIANCTVHSHHVVIPLQRCL